MMKNITSSLIIIYVVWLLFFSINLASFSSQNNDQHIYDQKIDNQQSKITNLPIKLPNVNPNETEIYLCSSLQVDQLNYVGAFTAQPGPRKPHHMILWGCEAPGNSYDFPNSTITDTTWQCWNKNNPNNQRSPCNGRQEFLYGWTPGTDPLKLPQGFGFYIGGNSGNNYLVIEVHFVQEGIHTSDDSGIILSLLPNNNNLSVKRVGMLFMTSLQDMPAKTKVNLEGLCRIDDDKQLYPMSFFFHTHHRLGLVASAYVVSNSSAGSEPNWILIGKQDPKKPQNFDSLADDMNGVVIKQGDYMAMRCTMENNSSDLVKNGHGIHDEKCTFFLMYYVDDPDIVDSSVCFRGGDSASWIHEIDVPENIHSEASQLIQT